MVPVLNPDTGVWLKKEGDKRKHSGVTQLFEFEGSVILDKQNTT